MNKRRPNVDFKLLRAELAHLRARYDGGAVSPGVYAIIRGLELDLAWLEHHRDNQ